MKYFFNECLTQIKDKVHVHITCVLESILLSTFSTILFKTCR